MELKTYIITWTETHRFEVLSASINDAIVNATLEKSRSKIELTNFKVEEKL